MNLENVLKLLPALLFAYAVLPESLSAQDSERVIELSPFEVSSDSDIGYYSSNSVSATKTNIAIKDLPINLQVLNREFIDDVNSAVIEDVMRYSASATPSTNAPGRFALRGFTNPEPMRNGINTLAESNFVSTLTTERIEIVKGPAAILYGITEPGGLINQITKKPTFYQRGSATLQYGDYDTTRAEIDSSGPIGGEDANVAYRMIAGYGHLGYEQDYAENDSFTVAPSLLFQIAPKTSLLAAFEYQELDQMPRGDAITKFSEDGNRIGFVQGFHYGLPKNFNHRGPDSYMDTEASYGTLDLQHEFQDDRYALRLVLNRGTTSIDQNARLGAGIERRGPDGEYGWVRTHALARFVDREEWVFQGELTGRFESDYATHRFLLGVEATDYEQDQVAKRQNNVVPLMDLRDPSSWELGIPIPISDYGATPADFLTDQQTSSAYLVHQGEFLSSRLHTMAGVRYDVVDSSTLNRRNSPPTLGEVPTTKNWTPQLGLLYSIADGVGAFASYSESFSPNTSVNPDGSMFDPATGEGVDIGLKYNSADHRVNVTLSYFDIRKTNIVRQDVERRNEDPEGRLWFAPSGEERSEGVELDLTLTPVDGYQVVIGYAYMDSYVVSNDDAPGEVGNPLAYAPEHSFALWNKYTFQEDSSLEGFYVGAGLNSRSKTYGNTQTANLTRPFFSYTTVDLLLGYKTQVSEMPLDLALRVNNLTDEWYFARQAAYADGRNVQLTARFEF